MACWCEYNLIGKIRDFHSLYMGSIPFIHLWPPFGGSTTAIPFYYQYISFVGLSSFYFPPFWLTYILYL